MIRCLFYEGGTMSGSNHRHDLTDKQWEYLEPFLPPLNTGVGRKMLERRQHINGMLERIPICSGRNCGQNTVPSPSGRGLG